MVEATLFILAVTAGAVVMFGLLPWAARAATTAALFQVREDLYDLADGCPSIRGTRTYRDVEFYVCLGIQLVRDHRAQDVWRFLLRTEGQPEKTPAVEQRRSRYVQEMADASPAELEALQEALLVTKRVRQLLSVRAVLGSGLPLLVFLFGFVVVVPALLAWRLTREMLDIELLSAAVEAAAPRERSAAA